MKISSSHLTPCFEFHVAKKIREKYDLDESFFSTNGHVIFANFYQVRLFVQKINSKRNINEHLSPGEVNGAGLLDEIYHLAIRNYIKRIHPTAFQSALSTLEEKLGNKNFDNLLLEFLKVFPPQAVYKNELSEKEYLKGVTDFVPNKEIVLEELILLHFANINPAFKKIKELFNEDYLEGKVVYKNTISSLKEFFKRDEFKIGINNSDMFDFLSQPFLKYSDSIWDQLEFIKNEWGIFIDHKLLLRIQSSKDLFIESIKFEPSQGDGGGAPTIVPQYKGTPLDADHLVIGKSRFRYAEESSQEYEEPEQFTQDVNWMPNLVLIAKNIYVWLDQLSKKYEREIRRLDQIPDEELQQLKDWNINGLWLIGVWERSSASKKIKHLMGNIDAVASAYSLYDYQIANDLGGEYAYNIFNKKAKSYGIRLASDMVPNHTGIYSKWVMEHPDYFIQLDHPPFPNYNFTGENLSEDPNVEIRIEDQYWEMKDAAVVFERKDLRTGQVKYFYHGNDGTNMPWNDTAQLNLLKPEVREALIQKIFEVARKFSVIRFDAAMTLAKKHYSRLWYPEPGKGGDIPSRADHALTRRQFDELFPQEFWREVVDRINNEMPETLLLAEAFWLMEGYFVRTLGMHRVYNSAFMNMLMNEENNKYRQLITNTLEFEPEILKRYVNFMSNPDEETAIHQFGDGDKYFGVLVLMSTLPGLPMFAHGQIEGYKEKYGMEYQRAYYDEKPADWLVERHEREIFPILNKRYVFSEVESFWIYDFLNDQGTVNENVFVYSNRYNNENGLVIYNNNFESVSGRFLFSRQKLNGNSSSNAILHNSNIAYNLGIKESDFHFYIFRDVTTGLEFFYNGKEIHSNGIFTALNGYEYRVYLYFEEIFDPTGEAYKFYKENYGNGRYNVKKELEKRRLDPLHNSFKEIFSKSILQKCTLDKGSKRFNKKTQKQIEEDLSPKFDRLFDELASQTIIKKEIEGEKEKLLSIYNEIPALLNSFISGTKNSKTKIDKRFLDEIKCSINEKCLLLMLMDLTNKLKYILESDELKNNYISSLMLTRPIKEILKVNIEDVDSLGFKMLLINIMLIFEDEFEETEFIDDDFLKLRSDKKLYDYVLLKNKDFISKLAGVDLFSTFLGINTYEGKTYYNKERFDEFISLLILWANLKYFKINRSRFKSITSFNTAMIRFSKKVFSLGRYLKSQSDKSEYLYDKLLKNIDLEN